MEKVKQFFLLSLLLSIMTLPVWGQGSATSSIAGFAATDSKPGGNGVPWNNPAGAKSQGVTQASVALPGMSNGLGTKISQYLVIRNFNVSGDFTNIPQNAVITGIQVTFWVASGTNVTDTAVSMLKSVGGSVTYVGTPKKMNSEWPNPGFGPAPRTYGGSSDLWGTTWTAADFKNTNFGVAISAQAIDTTGGKTATPIVDYAVVTVYFNPVDYYYDGSGPVTDTLNWGTNIDGTGKHPADFGEAFTRFNLINRVQASPLNITLGSNWGALAANSTIEIGGDYSLDDISLTIPNGITLSGIVRVNNRGILNSEQLGLPTFSLLDVRPLGRLQFTGTGDQTIPTIDTIYYLTLGGSGIKSFSGTSSIVLEDDLTFSGTAKGLLSFGQALVAPNNGTQFINYGPNNYIITNSNSLVRQQVINDSTPVFYPIGTSTSYNPLSIAVAVGGMTNYYGARVFEGVRTEYASNGQTASGSGTLTKDIVGRSWVVNRVLSDVTNKTAIKLQWNANEEFSGFNRDSAGIGYYLNTTTGVNLPDSPVFDKGPISAAAGSNPYSLVRSGLGVFDSTVYAIGDPQSPVPVEFTSFTGVRIEDYVHLNWNTASERNNKGFEVQRTGDMKEWKTLGFVNGNGTTVLPQSYTFDDKAPMSGINYYRLKQVDYDGKSAYSSVVAIDFAGSFVIDVFPNPAKGGSMTINLDNRDNEKLDIRLINIYGQEMLSTSTYDSNVKLNVVNVPNGNYILTVKAGNNIENRKVSIIR